MLQEDDMGASFFDETSKSASSASLSVDPALANPLFSSDYGVDDPWSTPSVNQGPNVENLLAGADLPLIYDSAWKQAAPSGGKISVATLSKMVDLGGLQPTIVEKIFHSVIPPSASQVNRNRFNVVLALVALGQKNMDVSIDNLRARREDLPHPVLPGLQSFSAKFTVRTQTSSRRSIDSVADPWRMSAVPTAPTPTTNGFSAAAGTTSANLSYDGVNSFAMTDDYQWYLEVDLVKVTVAPEREGFLFKHVNYILEVETRSSKVVRRYSDFWWLMETLQKRYPFRLLPNMPPKKVGGIDDTFLEKRRKGLARFINFIARHPILKEDEVVAQFLTVKEELASFRRANPPDLNEEFARRRPPVDTLQVRIPANLDEKLAKVRRRLGSSVEHYKNLSLIMERLVKRHDGASNDYIRYSMTLKALAESEKTCYEPDCVNCPQVIRGYESIANHMQTASSIMEDQYHASNDGVFEGLKRQRDLLVSLKELFERKERLEGNQADTLEKRMTTDQAKLSNIRSTPGSEAEVDQLIKSIDRSQRDIEYQRNRAVFIRFCMHTEVEFFHALTAHVSIVYQNFVTDQIKFSEMSYQNWRALASSVYEMPNDPTTGFG